jgi:hypothetical protein
MSSSKAPAGLGSQLGQPLQKRICEPPSTQKPTKRSKPSSSHDTSGLFGQSIIKSGPNTSGLLPGLFGQSKIIRPSAGLFGGSPPTESSFKVDLDKIHRIIENWSCEPSEIKGSWEEEMVLRKVQKILEEASYKWKERSSNLKD